MDYMIVCYGNNTPNNKTGIKTIEEAEATMKRMIKEWCKENDINIKDTDYTDGDHYFQYGEDEWGVGIFEIIEVPEYKNEIEACLWEAKLNMKYADYAMDEYKWTLTDCVSDMYIDDARGYIDKALELIKKEK